jgi:hypothetical protein
MTERELISAYPHAARTGWPSMSIEARQARSAAAYRNITIRMVDGHLILRDVRRQYRLPTADIDPTGGVRTLHVVGLPYYNAAQAGAYYGEVGGRPQKALYDYLVGLNEKGARLFDSPLGWPPEAVRDFCHATGLRYRAPRDFTSRWRLHKQHPRASGAVRLWSSRLSRLVSAVFAATFLFIPVVFVVGIIAAVVQAVR